MLDVPSTDDWQLFNGLYAKFDKCSICSEIRFSFSHEVGQTSGHTFSHTGPNEIRQKHNKKSDKLNSIVEARFSLSPAGPTHYLDAPRQPLARRNSTYGRRSSIGRTDGAVGVDGVSRLVFPYMGPTTIGTTLSSSGTEGGRTVFLGTAAQYLSDFWEFSLSNLRTLAKGRRHYPPPQPRSSSTRNCLFFCRV